MAYVEITKTDYNEADSDNWKENVARLEIKLKEMELRVETREGEERKEICFFLFFSFFGALSDLNRFTKNRWSN